MLFTSQRLIIMVTPLRLNAALARRLEGKKRDTASLALPIGHKVCLSAPLEITN